LVYASKLSRLQCGDLGLKITTTVYWFGHQNQPDYDLSVVPQTRWEDEDDAGTRRDLTAYFAWKQVELGFPSLISTLAEAQRRVVQVAPSWMLCRIQVEDGRHRGGCVEFKLKTDESMR
jgi:hypothetical protein